MKYLKNINDNKIYEFQENEIPIHIAQYEYISQNDIENIKLAKLRNEKLEELDKYYNSSECWSIKLVYNNSSLTKTCDWFAKMLPACSGRQIVLFTDVGQIIQFDLSEQMAKDLNYKIQGEISFNVMKAYKICKNAIDAANNISDLKNIDVKLSLGEVPRVIDLNSL